LILDATLKMTGVSDDEQARKLEEIMKIVSFKKWRGQFNEIE